MASRRLDTSAPAILETEHGGMGGGGGEQDPLIAGTNVRLLWSKECDWVIL